MATSAQLCREITAGRWDEALGALYGAQQLQRQRARYCAALEQFELYFGPGRQVQPAVFNFYCRNRSIFGVQLKE